MSRQLRPLNRELTVRIAYEQAADEPSYSAMVKARVLTALDALSQDLKQAGIDHRIEARVQGELRPHVFDYRRTK